LRRIVHPIGLVAFAAILAAWWLASSFRWVQPFLLPAPAIVLATGLELVQDGTLLRHTLISLQRVVLGYGLAVAIALPLALLFSLVPLFRRLLEPPLEFLRQLPPLALVPLLILWLGIGEVQKVGIIILACFFPIFLGTLGGITQADPRLVEVGRSCGLNSFAILRRIVLPAAMPAVAIGLRIGLGYSWRALVGAELIASSAGLGYLIVDAENLARTDIVLVGVLVIGVLGMLADLGMRKTIAGLFPWLKRELELGRA